jgi:5-methyltetrahydrofolate--homocysteine methyltransferase
MIIIGELINASRKQIAPAIENKDADTIQKIAKGERENGADFIDVNAGVFVGKESDYLKWLVTTVQETVEAPCCIDSPDPKAIETALSVHKGIPMINSISLEKERYEALLPVVSGTECKVVALCMSDKGMPETTDDRVSIADELINNLLKNNVPLDNIYVDPLVQPVSTKDSYGIEFLDAIEKIINKFPGVHTICGLSNISFGLPERKFLNQTFMVMAITKGLDAAIVNPLDKGMMAKIVAAETLAGKDEYCSQYLQAWRDKKFEL